jgi:hypothetical protein
MPATYEESSRQTERRILEVETGGAAVETVGGLAIIVLAILGLSGLGSEFLAASAGIVFGVAILAQGAAVAAEYSNLLSKVTRGSLGATEVGGGMTMEIVTGGAAIVLSILALLGDVPNILLPVMVISGGAALLMTAGTVQRLNNLKLTVAEPSQSAQRVLHAATSGAAGGQFLAGIAAIVLAIIALASMPAAGAAVAGAMSSWLTLTLIGLLVIGVAITLSGGSLASRMVEMFGREITSRD